MNPLLVWLRLFGICLIGMLVRPDVFVNGFSSVAAEDVCMVAATDSATGQVEIRDRHGTVLRYNYHSVEPPEGHLDTVNVNNRKYARARSDYIHPLYGLDGEELTSDWSVDHPHHRGVYWAWPEVDYRGERGDLHALQRVFARPTGKIELRSGDGFAEIEAENEWRWDDETPIVCETTTICARPAEERGRYIDLTFELDALANDVGLARRGTSAYGGLNIRLAPVTGLRLSHYADPSEASPRRAWQSAVGTWQDGTSLTSLAVIEHADNPHYPGDYVQYPELPWFQPTFPKTGARYSLKKGEPLVLKYRLWIRSGQPPSQADYEARWEALQTAAPTSRE